MIGSGEAVIDGTAMRMRRARRARPDEDPWTAVRVVEEPSNLSYAGLLAGLAHELRTPISALATGSELLLEDIQTISRADLERIALTMHRGALWLQGLVENVLCAATLSQGQLRISPRPLCLPELVSDVTPVVEPLLRQRSQTLRVIERRGLADVYADGRRMGQVLINLISNASKFSGPGTRIDLTLAPRGEMARVSVADRGTGIPEVGVKRLFAPYSRAPEAHADGVDGVGLGLAIVKSIVELHGGTVGAKRRAGGGSVFWVDLHVAAVGAAPVLVTDRLA